LIREFGSLAVLRFAASFFFHYLFFPALIVVQDTVAVGAKYNALFNFFHGLFEGSVFNKFTDRGFFGRSVYVMEVKRSWMILTALNAR